MKSTFSSKLSLALAACLIAGLSTSALAESQWAKNHPRRHEVNQRLKNQHRRIHREVKQGQLNRAQAGRLHREDHQIRQEERDMASQNGGHITRGEQGVLNRQENGVSQQIGK
ncbi:MAG: hypothetical protein ACLPXB_04430 [Thiobacillaceae bacterium]